MGISRWRQLLRFFHDGFCNRWWSWWRGHRREGCSIIVGCGGWRVRDDGCGGRGSGGGGRSGAGKRWNDRLLMVVTMTTAGRLMRLLAVFQWALVAAGCNHDRGGGSKVVDAVLRCWCKEVRIMAELAGGEGKIAVETDGWNSWAVKIVVESQWDCLGYLN
jgi:hypothetical protein